ncbi:MAG: amidohydrolase family protein, partial [Chloroflexi bacterium]|nr:amidohydrolase family protein [Chloroflexota bacterium]
MLDLSDITVVDNHVHPWRPTTSQLDPDQLAGSVAFSDGVITSVREPFLPSEQLAPSLKLLRETNLGAHYLLVHLARLLNVEDNWSAVTQARNTQSAANYAQWTKKLFDDVGLDTLCVDEGGATPRITLDELGAIAPVRLRRVARSDNLIRDLLPAADDWHAFFRGYQSALDVAIREGAIAFKSVIAYRSGLDVEPVSESAARADFEAHRDAPLREQKVFRDFLLCHTLDVARERGVWIHIHTAVGDPDIVYERANPARLYPLLHAPRFRANRVVLIHAGWPWVGEAAAMAAILPNVYLDVSEGALFGMPNVRQRIMEALEACPYAKILYGGDGSLPEAVWIAAKRYKDALARALTELTDEGFCSADQAREAA